MQLRHILRFSVALAAEISLFTTLNFFDDWTIESTPVKFVIAAILCGLAYLLAVSQFALFAKSRWQALIFWSVVVLLRLIALPLAPSDDLWRYQWEGKIQRAGFNPYVLAPDAPELEALRADFSEWQKINHRDFRAIYPPGAEILFAGMTRISDRPLFYKLVFAGADVATIGLLLLLIGGPSRFVNVAWYAWNPLVAYSFAGAAHFDSLMLLPMVAGVLCLLKYENATRPDQKWIFASAAAFALGLAISIKLIPLLLLLLCVFALGIRAFVLLISLAIPVLLSLLYGYPKVPIWESLGSFAYVTRLNDLFWWLTEDTVWANPHEKNYHYNVIIIVAVALVSLLFIRNWKRGMLWAIGTALILSPVLHPWYCTWILPFATWRRAYPWHMLSVTLFAYYLFWNVRLFQVPWHTEPWLRAIIIVPTLLSIVMFALRKKAARVTI
jgi:alpha-1,6-mannosyltransferase